MQSERGKNSEHDRFKVRCVMLGNQLNAAEARRRKRALAGGEAGAYVELRETVPTLRHSSFKCSSAVGVIKGMRRAAVLTLLVHIFKVHKSHARCMCARPRIVESTTSVESSSYGCCCDLCTVNLMRVVFGTTRSRTT